MGSVPGLHVVTEPAVEIFVIQHSEGDLRGRAARQEEPSETVAQPGLVPEQAEQEGGEQEELHVYGHVPGHVDTVRLSGTVDISGEVVYVEKI